MIVSCSVRLAVQRKTSPQAAELSLITLCPSNSFKSLPLSLSLHCLHTPCPDKKSATDFFAITFTNIDGLSYFFVHTFTRECQSHWRKNFLPHFRYVATIPCENVRHKSNTFDTILALCTFLYRSHLGGPVSMKQTKNTAESQRSSIPGVKMIPFPPYKAPQTQSRLPSPTKTGYSDF